MRRTHEKIWGEVSPDLAKTTEIQRPAQIAHTSKVHTGLPIVNAGQESIATPICNHLKQSWGIRGTGGNAEAGISFNFFNPLLGMFFIGLLYRRLRTSKVEG